MSAIWRERYNKTGGSAAGERGGDRCRQHRCAQVIDSLFVAETCDITRKKLQAAKRGIASASAVVAFVNHHDIA
ncbi:hypothetical protein [Methylocystis hirsuta]|uniref:hypothetical protein n=1 Tax=Methylocystis hirsuta TaxID=369798 RepID=UPI0011CE7FE7|nr:hypothetical protein [Methylocystis hirsuta]